MSRWNWKANWLGWMACAVAMPGAAFLLGSGDLPAQGPRTADSRTARGTVERMTTAPKGEIDGAVLDDGTVLHWPPHLADQFSSAVGPGDRVSAVGQMETNREGEDWFEVQTLTNLDSDATVKNDERGHRPKKGRKGAPPLPRQSAPNKTIRGTVERMTTAPKGEIDGAVLDDGRVIHWPPHMQDRFTNVVAKGDRVEVTGFQETTPKGDEHFEVQSLTNLRTDATAKNDDNAGSPRRANTDGRAERLRQLKRQVERLQREIERLERDL